MRVLLFVLIMVVVHVLPVEAQDDLPAPQFLYRDDDQLVFINGYTGETMPMNHLTVSEHDRFEWSPDGTYLIAYLGSPTDEYRISYCLNLFDVDAERWVYEEPIACGVGDSLFSDDLSHLYYTVNGNVSGSIWEFTLADSTNAQLFATYEGTEINPRGVGTLYWSPTAKYLVSGNHTWIMGGTVNTLILINIETGSSSEIAAPNSYYAHYQPIWSHDDRWILIRLHEQYVESGGFPHTNHEGDVYLVNSDSGESTRLTYSPAQFEYNLAWTDDGRITFSTITTLADTHEYSIAEALRIEPVARDQIVYPDPVDRTPYYPGPPRDYYISRDPHVAAWVEGSQTDPDERMIHIGFSGFVASGYYEAGDFEHFLGIESFFTFPIPSDGQLTDIIIGWRPSDIAYMQG